MALNSSTNSLAGIYKKELTEYDLNRMPHKQQKGEDGHLLRQSDLIDTLSPDFSCPICLDLLTNTMVTECLHRFCSECIKKSLYKGNRECPTCRKKIISKRNLRADPNMDKLIDTIWPDRQLHEALQREKAQNWNKHIDVVALQRSIAEGMRAQTNARDHQANNASGDRPAGKRAEVLLGQIENKGADSKKASLSHKHSIGCSAKKLCLRSDRATQKGGAADADFGFDGGCSSAAGLSSSSEDSSYEPSSDEEEHTQLPKSLIVNVDMNFFNKKIVDDAFIGRLNKEKGMLSNAVTSNSKRARSRQTVEDESSGFWSASPSSSPYPPKEPRAFPQNTLADCKINFGVVGSMESAMREYVSKMGQLGLITIELVPLHELHPVVDRFLVKLMHRATIGQLHDKVANNHKNMTRAKFSFFIRTYYDQMTQLHAGESLCTVLALARRPNFFDYPTIFFTTENPT